jgi:hypothetical protein
MIHNWSNNCPPGNCHHRPEKETMIGQVKRQGNSTGTVHVEIIQEVTVKKHCYKEILHHLYISIHYKHPELWSRNNWLLL